jgi:hypothetical protein
MCGPLRVCAPDAPLHSSSAPAHSHPPASPRASSRSTDGECAIWALAASTSVQDTNSLGLDSVLLSATPEY